MIQESRHQRLDTVVERIEALAAAVQHQVVGVDRRVLVAAEGAVPRELGSLNFVQRRQLARLHRRSWHGPDDLAAPAHAADRQAAEVDQRLADLRDLPVEHGDHRPVLVEQQVAEVIVGVDEARHPRIRVSGSQRAAQPLEWEVEVGARSLEQRLPAREVGGQADRLLHQSARGDGNRVQAPQRGDRGKREPALVGSLRLLFDPLAAHHLEQDERPAVDHGLAGHGNHRGDRKALLLESGHDPDLWSRARRAATALSGLGVRRSDAVLVMLDNTIEFVDAWLGLALIGAIQVPVNTQYLGEILRHHVKDSGAWLMLVEATYVERLGRLGADRGGLRRLVVSGDAACPSGLECQSWASVFDQAGELAEDAIANMAERDIVAIMYTSGTTGPSKGVRVAQAHAHTYARLAGHTVQLSEGDVYFAPLPLFHIAGQWALVYACLQVGATAIVRRRFSVTDFWTVARESHANVGFLLGAMANFLGRQDPRPDDRDNPMERMLMVPLVDDVDDFRQL